MIIVSKKLFWCCLTLALCACARPDAPPSLLALRAEIADKNSDAERYLADAELMLKEKNRQRAADLAELGLIALRIDANRRRFDDSSILLEQLDRQELELLLQREQLEDDIERIETENARKDVLLRAEEIISKALVQAEDTDALANARLSPTDMGKRDHARLAVVRQLVGSAQSELANFEAEDLEFQKTHADNLRCTRDAIAAASLELSRKQATAAHKYIEAGFVCLRRMRFSSAP